MIFDASRRAKRRMDAAQGYLMLNLPDRALRELDEIVDAGEATCQYHLLRGEALRAKSDHPAALTAFRRALEANPEDLAALMGMAWCFKRIDRLDQSIETMQRAYESHKEVPVVLYNLACYYSLAGEKELALSWLGRALRMDRGFTKLVPKETDFDPLRDDPDFLHLLELTAK
ncbi:MAG: tetratricopeptide repeat protein [Planctomycetota bacterium]